MSHLFQYVDCQILYHRVTSLEKNHFMKCCIFSESHQTFLTRVLIFELYPHCAGKCMTKLYAVYIAGAWQSLRKVKVFELSTHFQVSHSNSFVCLVRYYAGLALIVLILMEEEADGHILLSA